MSGPGQPIYLVNVEGDPVRLLVRGRASYTNCAPVQQFLDRITAEGDASLEIDFSECTGMDSTFMGLLAGSAIHMRRRATPGEISLVNLSPHNLELIRNLGLHRLLRVVGASGSTIFPAHKLATDLPESPTRAASHETILRAHEDLMQVDPMNVSKFQDVVAFMKRGAPPKP